MGFDLVVGLYGGCGVFCGGGGVGGVFLGGWVGGVDVLWLVWVGGWGVVLVGGEMWLDGVGCWVCGGFVVGVV